MSTNVNARYPVSSINVKIDISLKAIPKQASKTFEPESARQDFFGPLHVYLLILF